MGLGLGRLPTQTAELGANKRGAMDHAPRTNHRASRQRQRAYAAYGSPRHLRPMRRMRYAYHRPRSLLALLFAW
jgi:hypothetical protein